jgi:hypothetical protein
VREGASLAVGARMLVRDDGNIGGFAGRKKFRAERLVGHVGSLSQAQNARIGTNRFAPTARSAFARRARVDGIRKIFALVSAGNESARRLFLRTRG